MVMLTIAIPSYNRNDLLSKNIASILPQLSDSVHLLIIDNASTVPISETLLVNSPFLKVIRNSQNIGGNGNILRCFETCQSDWIWIIGDDDRAEVGAVEHILKDIISYLGLYYINYEINPSTSSRQESIETTGITSLLNGITNFGDILFISRGIFNVAKLNFYIDYGYHYAYSCGPHLAMLFMALRENGKCLVSNFPIISWERPIIENRGSLVPIGLGLPSLLELPLTDSDRRSIAKKMAYFPSLYALVHRLLLNVIFSDMSARESRRIFRAISKKIPMGFAFRRYLSTWFLGIMLFFPRLSFHFIVKPLYKYKTGHETGANKLGVNHL